MLSPDCENIQRSIHPEYWALASSTVEGAHSPASENNQKQRRKQKSLLRNKIVREMDSVFEPDNEHGETMPKYVREYHESMLRQQEETRAILKVLNENMKKLVDITEQKFAAEAFSDDELSLDSPEKENSTEEEDEEEGVDTLIARTTVRLDGLEVYAVVSALTCATLYQCFESFNGYDWGVLYRERRFVELLADVVFLLSSATGILAGLHSTLIFSLMTMYGRTSIGMGHDEAFGKFFQKTGAERYRGFQTFLWSLYAFLVQVVIMITSKVTKSTRMVFFAGIFYFMLILYKDTHTIIQSAGIIFVPDKKRKRKKKKKSRISLK